MAEPAANFADFEGADAGQCRRSASPARCLRCSTDLSKLPQFGRYCPRCGLDSYCSPPAALLTRSAESSIGGKAGDQDWNHLAELSHAVPTPLPSTVIPCPDSTSLIVRGYANALYKLGRRYEVSLGHGNPREAVRCYLKAARLGNMMAFARLAARWIDGFDSEVQSKPADRHSVDPAHVPVA